MPEPRQLRVGRHHGVTIVEHEDTADRGVMVAAITAVPGRSFEDALALAQEIVAAVNGQRSGESRSDPGRTLVADALFLLQYGERPPGAPVDPGGETWREWAHRAETHLRGEGQ